MCAFYSLSIDNIESLDNQLSLSGEYREMKISFFPPPSFIHTVRFWILIHID